jgi:hypothetical protein
MRILTVTLVVPVIALVTFASFRGQAQDRAAIGTVFIDSRDGARNLTVSRQGAVLAWVTLPRGTVLSAVDEHRSPAHLGGGRYEFHGDFELRALSANEVPSIAPSGSIPAAELMSHAPLILSAHGVDVILEKAPEPR